MKTLVRINTIFCLLRSGGKTKMSQRCWFVRGLAKGSDVSQSTLLLFFECFPSLHLCVRHHVESYNIESSVSSTDGCAASERGNTSTSWEETGGGSIAGTLERMEQVPEGSMDECDWLENLSEDPYYRGLQDKVAAVRRQLVSLVLERSRGGNKGGQTARYHAFNPYRRIHTKEK